MDDSISVTCKGATKDFWWGLKIVQCKKNCPIHHTVSVGGDNWHKTTAFYESNIRKPKYFGGNVSIGAGGANNLNFSLLDHKIQSFQDENWRSSSRARAPFNPSGYITGY